MKVLYISYDGLTDPLGRSQILPYLLGLEKKGVAFHILSCDKPGTYRTGKDAVDQLISGKNIEWHPVSYSNKYPVISAILNKRKLKKTAGKLMRIERFDIVHCRSHIASDIGFSLKRKSGCRFIFDMRGFFADERVEGGLWNLKNPLYKAIYRYFKKKERAFLRGADYTISLTKAGERVIHFQFGFPDIPIQVIPCCADLDFFSRDKIDQKIRSQYFRRLDIDENRFVISYIGSVGTWYLSSEMLRFFKRLKEKKKDAVFLFITPDKPQMVEQLAEREDVDLEDIRIYSARREEVPVLLSMSKISVFFIKPSFSKKASSPTKMGEILGLGIPLIANDHVGDVEEIIDDLGCGVVLKGFTDRDFDQVVEQIDDLAAIPPEVCIKTAEKYYSLENGVEKYWEVYRKIME